MSVKETVVEAIIVVNMYCFVVRNHWTEWILQGLESRLVCAFTILPEREKRQKSAPTFGSLQSSNNLPRDYILCIQELYEHF